MSTKPTVWPGTQIPKSTGNAFDLTQAKPSGFATAHEVQKAQKQASTEITAFSHYPMPGLSKKAQKALKVPAKRVSISIGQPRTTKRMSVKAAI